MKKEQEDCRVDVVFGEAYRQVTEGASLNAVLDDLCLGLADALGLAFIWLAEQQRKGDISLAAASHDGSLRDYLTQHPERIDAAKAQQGPGAKALKASGPHLEPVSAKGRQGWQKAALQQGVHAVMAIGLENPGINHWVVAFGAAKTSQLDNAASKNDLSKIATRMRRLLPAAIDCQQNQLLRKAMESAGNAVLITDSSGEIEWANPAFSRLSGYHSQDIIGQNPRVLKSGKQRPRYYQRLWRSLMAGRIWTGETVDKDSKGELFTIRQTISPVMANGKPEHFISIHEDISSQKAMQSAHDRARRYDDITGLLTPALFYDRLSIAIRDCQKQQQHLALLLLTLEIFDSSDDNLNSDMKLALLQTLGTKIREILGPDDFAASIGDGEFAIVLQDKSNHDAEDTGKHLLQILNHPMPELGERVFLDPHIGIAVCPEDDSNVDGLIHLADLRASRSGALALSS